MKTSMKFAALGLFTLIGVVGCGEDNNGKSLVNAEGNKSAPGAAAPGAATSSADAAKKQQSMDPTQNDQYKKQMQGK